MDVAEQETRFESLYEQYNAVVLGYFLRRLDREDAVDATADVFLTAWRRIDAVPTGPETRMWLFGVAGNVLRNRQRSNRRFYRLVSRLRSVPVDHVPSPETAVVQKIQGGDIVATLGRLRPGDREVIQLRLWEEATYDEIAAVLGCSRHAAEQRYAAALSRLARVYPPTGHVWTSRNQPAPSPQEHIRDS